MIRQSLSLRIVTASEPPRTMTLDRDIVKIGSLESSHVRLTGDDVSRIHAVIERTDEGWSIIDLGSASGTIVNGERINQVLLKSTSSIQIGSYFLYPSFEYVPPSEDETPPAAENLCPRCRQELTTHRWKTEGGYRGGVMFDFRRCQSCELSVMSSDTIAKRYDRADGRLSGTMLERERRACQEACPDCLGELLRLTLTWGTTWVELEECPECGTIVMDDGEGPSLDRLLEESGV